MKLQLELIIEVDYEEGSTDSIKEHLTELVHNLADGIMKHSDAVQYNVLTNKVSPQKSNAILLLSNEDGYEALYVDGKLVADGAPINEGGDRIQVFTALAEQYNFSLSEMATKCLSQEDDAELCDSGCFCEYLYEYSSKYD